MATPLTPACPLCATELALPTGLPSVPTYTACDLCWTKLMLLPDGSVCTEVEWRQRGPPTAPPAPSAQDAAPGLAAAIPLTPELATAIEPLTETTTTEVTLDLGGALVVPAAAVVTEPEEPNDEGTTALALADEDIGGTTDVLPGALPPVEELTTPSPLPPTPAEPAPALTTPEAVEVPAPPVRRRSSGEAVRRGLHRLARSTRVAVALLVLAGVVVAFLLLLIGKSIGETRVTAGDTVPTHATGSTPTSEPEAAEMADEPAGEVLPPADGDVAAEPSVSDTPATAKKATPPRPRPKPKARPKSTSPRQLFDPALAP